MRDLQIRIPRTATRRNAPSFAKLLERVEPRATSPYDFHGRLLTPGETIDESELWPSEHYPAIPVVLETCQVCFEGRGHNRNPYEFILWIYQRKTRDWRQVAHVSAHHPEEWIAALLPVALKLVKPAVDPPAPDLHQAARRIAAVVESELLTVSDNSQRSLLLQCTHDYLCQRRSDLGMSRKAYQLPLRPPGEDYFEGLLVAAMPDHLGWTVKDQERVRLIYERPFP